MHGACGRYAFGSTGTTLSLCVNRAANRRSRGKAPGLPVELSSPLWDQLAQKHPLPLLTEKQVIVLRPVKQIC